MLIKILKEFYADNYSIADVLLVLTIYHIILRSEDGLFSLMGLFWIVVTIVLSSTIEYIKKKAKEW